MVRHGPEGLDEAPDEAPQGAAQQVPEGTAGAGTARLTAWVRGRVQGVGFRWSTRAAALRLGLVGSATNLADGRVEIVAEGPRAACEELLAWLQGPGTPGSVSGVTARWGPPTGAPRGFVER
ncbi:MAG TPA: acylphosphatase [Frankiaceae bacterium]